MVELGLLFPEPRRTNVLSNYALCEFLDEDQMSFLVALQQLHQASEEKENASSGYMLHEIAPKARRTHMFPFGATAIITTLIKLKLVEAKNNNERGTPTFALTQAGQEFQARKIEALPA